MDEQDLFNENTREIIRENAGETPPYGAPPHVGGAAYIGALSAVPLEPDAADEDKMHSAYKRAGFGSLAFYQVFQTVASAVFAVGIMLVVMLVVVGPYFRGESVPEFSIYNISETILGFASDPRILIATVLYAAGNAAGMIAAIFVFKLILSKRHFEAIPKRDLTGGQFWIVVLSAFSLWGLGVYVGNFPAMMFPVPNDLNAEIMESLGLNVIPLYLYAIFGAPVFEELALRKVLLDRTHKYGKLPAAVVSGLLFGLIHGNSGQFIFAFFLGMIFAAVYLYTGKIFYTILLHFMINFTGTVPDLLYLAGIDISVGFYIFIAAVAVAGLPVAIIAFRRDPVFRLSPSVFERPARLVVTNPGMLTAIIIFSVSLIITDFLNTGMNVLYYGPEHLLGLIPVAVSAAVIISALVYVDHTYKEPDGPDEESGSPEVPSGGADSQVSFDG